MSNDELVLKILKKTGMSEKSFWGVVKNKIAKGISEDGAIKMIASEHGMFIHTPEKEKPVAVPAVERKYSSNDISSLKEGDKAIVRAAIMHVFDIKNMFFYACPKCGKSVKGDYCQTHKNAVPQMAMKLSCILDDGTANVRAIMFTNALQNVIGMSADDAYQICEKEGAEAFLKNVPLGEDFIFSGNIRLNSFFGKNEMVVGNVKNVSVLDEIDVLGKAVVGVGLNG
ncbi:hypothetical protein CL614_06435 [archaeon]|nr:hypothetical protein [archaeon]